MTIMYRKKTLSMLLILMMTAALACSCGSDSGPDTDSGDGTYTESGYEYRAEVEDDGTAFVEYLDARLEIEEAEYSYDDFDEQTYLVLHMTFTNDSSIYRADGDEDTDFYLDSLDKAFVIQAVQDGEVIEHRSEPEAETIEEENCWELIDSGEWRECEMYFPIDIQKDVTVQVLNPDGEDTVMAELSYTPQ